MPLSVANAPKTGEKMPTNTCKVRINSDEQTTTTSAILCTKDTEDSPIFHEIATATVKSREPCAVLGRCGADDAPVSEDRLTRSR